MRTLACSILFILGCSGESLQQKDEEIKKKEAQIAALQNELAQQRAAVVSVGERIAACEKKLTTPPVQPPAPAAVDPMVSSTVRGRVLDIERWLGERVLDDRGEFIDLARTLCHLRQKTERKFNRNREVMRRAAIADFGIETGLAVINAPCPDDGALKK